MIDIQILRKNPELFKSMLAMGRGNAEKFCVDEWLVLDKKKQALELEIENVNRNRKQTAAEKTKTAEGKILKEKLGILNEELKRIQLRWQEILDWAPNIPLDPLKPGKTEAENVVVRAWCPKVGALREANGRFARHETENLFMQYPIHGQENMQAQHHLDIGERLGVIDLKQGSKTSGSRFTYLLGDLVLVQNAVQQLLFKELVSRGFMPMISPLLTRERALYGSSHFPEGRDQIYAIKNDNVEDNAQLYLIGSTEPANFAYFADKIFDREKLPIKLFAYAPAFRSEAGSWGRDLKGIKRLHQFDKIEMNTVCLPEQSTAVYEEFLEINEWLLQQLELPYQIVEKCAGEMGYLAAAKQADVEYWLGGQKEFMEFGTDTNATDYQARRLNIRYKTKEGKLQFVHTVNDTGVAMGRMLIAILDNYQQPDGSVKIPKVLQPYMFGRNVIR